MRVFFILQFGYVCLFTFTKSKKGYKNKRQIFLVMRELFCTQDQVVLLFTLVQVNGKFNSVPIYSRVVRSFLTSRD